MGFMIYTWLQEKLKKQVGFSLILMFDYRGRFSFCFLFSCSIDLSQESVTINCAAWRRYEATQWLESQVGPLGISKKPSERELVSCLRNGLILCNAINKIHPGIVPKVL